MIIVKTIKHYVNYSFNFQKEQWWITGFNPNHLRDEVDVHKQVMICSIDFSDNIDVYNALFLTSKIESDDYNENTEKFCMFDYEEKMVWIVWYTEV